MSRRAAAAVVMVLAVAASGCTTTQKISVVQAGDDQLGCEQLRTQFAQLDKVMLEAQSNKGLNAANITAALLFAPALLANTHDADKAEQLVEQRRGHLMRIYKAKNCG